MIRTKGEPGTGDIVQAVRHMRKMNSEISKLVSMREDELFEAAKQLQVPYDLVLYVHENGKLPVVNFAAGGVATPADAAGIGEIPMTFIRAPYIKEVWGDAEVLAEVDGKIVAARQGNQLVTAFHPELNESLEIHKYFLGMCSK